MRRAVVSLWSLLTLLAGCASAPPEGGLVFAFVVDGVTYEIHSARADSENAANYLVRRDETGVRFRARDDDQNGTIDAVLMGDLSLDQANQIYVSGIAAAQRKGKVSVREPARLFKAEGLDGEVAVWTVMIGSDQWYNRFAHYQIDESTLLATDVDADGVLDETDEGGLLPPTAQPHYERALQMGLRDGRIERIGVRYRVRTGGGTSPPPTPESRP